MGTEGFAQVMARSMDGYLAMQSAFGRGMEQYLRALNLPTRADITGLGERVGQLEQRIEELTGLLATRESEALPAPSATPAPRRTAKTRAAAKRADRA
jgi:hypothetical protein